MNDQVDNEAERTPYFTPQADGSIELNFNLPREGDFLASLAEHLRNTLMGSQVEAGAEIDLPLQRLFPAAYVEEAEFESQYQNLTRDDLLNTRIEQLQVFERCVTASSLAPDEIPAFMSALNALRLVMGTALDVSESDDPREMLPSESDDYTQDEFVHLQFYYLGNLLGELVDAADSAKAMARD